jgi:hypothetical protein
MVRDLVPRIATQPLSFSNIVNIGFQLYRTHLKSYLGISVIVMFWGTLPFVVAAAIAAYYVVARSQYEFSGLIIPAWIVLWLFYLAKSLATD